MVKPSDMATSIIYLKKDYNEQNQLEGKLMDYETRAKKAEKAE